MILTTDHGTMRVDHPPKSAGIVKPPTTTCVTSGKNLYNPDEVMEIRTPELLPKPNVSSSHFW